MLSALSLKLMCGESKFWLVMLWFAFRIKSAYLEGSFHFMFSYDLQCYYQAQVSLCGPLWLEIVEGKHSVKVLYTRVRCTTIE